MEAFLTAAEQAYGRDNPYHNSTHAADVVQAAFIMLRSVQQPQFTKLEVRSSCCCPKVAPLLLAPPAAKLLQVASRM